jgi:hypothetical protein
MKKVKPSNVTVNGLALSRVRTAFRSFDLHLDLTAELIVIASSILHTLSFAIKGGQVFQHELQRARSTGASRVCCSRHNLHLAAIGMCACLLVAPIAVTEALQR